MAARRPRLAIARASRRSDRPMRDFHFPGRSPVHSTRAMAATSHPAATWVALDTLRAGGNAVDAAIAAAAVLAVVECTETGIGGDCFALYAPSGGPVVALNASGAAPEAACAEWFVERGIRELTLDSPHAVTVPGAIAGWTRLHADHGRLPLSQLFAPAVDLAEGGFVVHSRIAWDWQRNAHRLAGDSATMFLPLGRAPTAGERHRLPQLARTLADIGEHGRDAFYTGPVARGLVKVLRERGGVHTEADFAAQQAQYVDPIATTYRGLEVLQCPPNGKGVAALLMLNILQGFELDRLEPLSPQRLHLQGEATRLALGAAARHVGDPDHADIPVQALLSAEFADRLRARISPARAMPEEEVAVALHSDTIYLTVVDEERNVISFINSLFHTFGSGIACPESGVLLHNRGLGFVVQPEHPNSIGARKRPMHTILPALAMKNGVPLMPFAVMGGQYQPTGQAQVLCNIVDFGMDLQEAIDLPRSFRFDGAYQLENGIPDSVAKALEGLGHRVVRNEAPLGGAQAIHLDWAGGILTGGSDSRKDGCALGY